MPGSAIREHGDIQPEEAFSVCCAQTGFQGESTVDVETHGFHVTKNAHCYQSGKAESRRGNLAAYLASERSVRGYVGLCSVLFVVITWFCMQVDY